MNDNFKNSLITIFGTTWTIPAGLVAFSLYQNHNLDVFPALLATILLLIALALSYIFFGPKGFISRIFIFIQTQFSTLVSIILFIIFGGLLTSSPEAFPWNERIGMFLISVLSGYYIVNKIRPFANLRLTKSFFKENLELMDKWIATETNNEQQTDYREISLNGKPLKKLVFTIRPASPFWRAGFKLTDPNGTILPLRTNNSLIFHLGSTGTDDRFGITAYINGEWVEALNKTLPLDRQKPISIRFEVSDKNFIKCFINDQVEFEPAERIDPRILKKAFLAAWGDDHNMRVEFDSVGFLTR